jgi:putative surface-exposed virulence protein
MVLMLIHRHLARACAALALFTLAACNGTAVVTLTSTASSDNYLTYRVGVSSVQLQKSNNGGTAYQVLPSGTTVDLAKLVNLADVVGSVALPRGTYGNVVITLDYTSAQIVYDDGSVNGVALTPIGAGGQAVGQVSLTLDLDPSNNFTVTSKQASWLALDFKLAASNIVNLSAKTVTVAPLIVGSASPIDSKTVRIRGPLSGSVNTQYTQFTLGIMPFDFSSSGAGSLLVAPTDITTYEINGTPSTGTLGFTQLGALSSGTMAEAYGTFATQTDDTTDTVDDAGTTTTGASTVDDETATGTVSSSTNVTFTASQVLAGSSAQGSGFDQISGIVSARSGNVLTVEDGTLLANNGSNSFLSGTATIDISANTAVSTFGQGSPQSNATPQISVGSLIYAFGTATTTGTGDATLNASAGRVRLGTTSAWGLVTQQGTGTVGADGTVGIGSLTLGLTQLGGRSVQAFDFTGTGTSVSFDANANEYVVSTGTLDLTNSTVGVPVEVTGLVTAFGQAPPDFTASALLDPTTINAEMVVDFGSGTPAPFTSYDTSQMVVDITNSSIGPRHEIQIGSQVISTSGMSSDVTITPNSSTLMFAIAHTVSGTVENFNEYSNFITQLQTELNGSVLVTGVTAIGQYTVASFAFAANSITVTLYN